jgi:hypothetical protein
VRPAAASRAAAAQHQTATTAKGGSSIMSSVNVVHDTTNPEGSHGITFHMPSDHRYSLPPLHQVHMARTGLGWAGVWHLAPHDIDMTNASLPHMHHWTHNRVDGNFGVIDTTSMPAPAPVGTG